MSRLVRLLSFAVSFPVTLAAIVFAVTNRGPVTVDFWPFALAVDVPVYVLALGTLAIGMGLGALLTWFPFLLTRQALARARRRLEELETDLARNPVKETRG